MPALFLFALSAMGLYAQGNDVDTSGCSVALERFFYNGIENRANLQRIWYDREGRVVLSAFLDADGSERTRKIYRYDEYGQRVEFSVWDRDGSAWRRWYYARAERRVEGGFAVYTERTSSYGGQPRLSSVTKLRPDGSLAYAANYGGAGDYSIDTYDEYGNVLTREYEHEKTDGVVRERYSYRYEGDKPVYVELRDETGVLLTAATNAWSGGLLLSTDTTELATGARTLLRYSYKGGMVTRMEWLDPSSGAVGYALSYEYDDAGRLVKTGEWSPSYERYWLYEFE
ncbi:MAG TPA: hypothetical protein DCG47_03500 [Spirochaetaceae bacterium]|nr:hypothetical protein [Spirochaetaceae bacterium]